MTEDPRRLLDDDATSSLLRRDLVNTRDADTGFDVDAAVARFETGLGDVPGSDALVTAKSAVKGTTWWIVGGGAVAAAALAWSLGRDSAPATIEPAPAVVVRSPAIEPVRTDDPNVSSQIVPSPAATPPPPTPPSPAIAAPAPTTARKRAPASVPAPSARDEDDDALAREMAATAAAKRALASDPSRALELVADANREFGKSVYAEDREGIAVLALARLGRDAEALTRGKAYLAVHPKGSYADRIRDVLGEAAEKP